MVYAYRNAPRCGKKKVTRIHNSEFHLTSFEVIRQIPYLAQ